MELKCQLEDISKKLEHGEKRTIPGLQSKLVQKEREKTAKLSELDDLLIKLDGVKEDLNKQKNYNTKLEKTIASNNQDLAAKKGEIGNLNAEIDRLKKKLDTESKTSSEKAGKQGDQIRDLKNQVDAKEKDNAV